MMYGYNGLYIPHMFGFGSLLTIIFWGFIIYGLMMIFKNSRHHSRSTTVRVDPVDILKERYVKGEITKEVFESMKKDIE